MAVKGRLGEERVKEFLREDIGQGDITSTALVDENQKGKARLYFREEGIAAGIEEASMVFNLLGCNVEIIARDGDLVNPGENILIIEGPARALLAGERTALNIICRMSGIATKVAEVQRIILKENPDIRVAATRKTAPGLRVLDKKAVELGGGDTHRFRLDDCVLIKDNHLALVPSITEAVRRVRERVSFTKKIEVEVSSPKEAFEAAEAGADVVMFDNMRPSEIRNCIGSLIEKGLRDGRVFEASGGINLENVQEYVASGVDIISMGCLTHSVRSLNAKLEIEMV
ncbi:MAG: carboxylating nicotinate-nucleotide diphosphorylase [Candidatus Bathyarchaeota archaeon]|jgi:nicotinate-nucleotide pyrophosphorylase (carboxylating)